MSRTVVIAPDSFKGTITASAAAEAIAAGWRQESPDDDIRLLLKSKFAELCRQYGLNRSTWPTPEDLEILVMNASGQFIYAATVIRWIATTGTLPQTQLELVLGMKPEDSSNPFSVLDTLYTAILRSSPIPESTVLWLKSLWLIQRLTHHPSAWTIDRLFEASAGQAKMLFGIPSLVYIPERDHGSSKVASSDYGVQLEVSPSLTPRVGWNTGYAFYHKSFLDYLEDHSRCGAAFPSIDNDQVEQWLWDRFAQTLKC